MILDDNLVFEMELPNSSSYGVYLPPLTSFMKPGRVEPIPFVVMYHKDFAPSDEVTVKIKQTDDPDNPDFETVWSFTAKNIIAGKNIGPRFLPSEVTKNHLMIEFSSATSIEGPVTVAFTREDELMYDSDMYIDKGVKPAPVAPVEPS